MGTAKHVALLRGINVGGRHKLPMKQLAAMFEAEGAEAVRTYIQSGNVVYAAAPALGRTLGKRVEAAIARDCGFEAPVVTRTAREWAAVLRGNPFLKAGVDPDRLHVAFLAARPSVAASRGLDPDRSPPDRFTLIGRELFLDLPKGVARTKLSNAYFDRALGTVSTARNWKTVLAIGGLLDAD